MLGYCSSSLFLLVGAVLSTTAWIHALPCLANPQTPRKLPPKGGTRDEWGAGPDTLGRCVCMYCTYPPPWTKQAKRQQTKASKGFPMHPGLLVCRKQLVCPSAAAIRSRGCGASVGEESLCIYSVLLLSHPVGPMVMAPFLLFLSPLLFPLFLTTVSLTWWTPTVVV
jgi:hypothetical protein